MRNILLALERIYRPSFSELNLHQWTGSIYTWLTHPLLDPQKSGRVIMDHLMKLITTALEWSYAQGEQDVSPKHLEAAAEQLTLRRDVIFLIDVVERCSFKTFCNRTTHAANRDRHAPSRGGGQSMAVLEGVGAGAPLSNGL